MGSRGSRTVLLGLAIIGASILADRTRLTLAHAYVLSPWTNRFATRTRRTKVKRDSNLATSSQRRPIGTRRADGALQMAGSTRAGTTIASSSSSSPSSSPSLSSSSSTPNLRLVQGIRDVVDEFDVFLLDMWGVMHDGANPYDGVLDVVQQLRKANKRLIIVSNSSKRQDNSIRMLNKLGFRPDDFELIITSGEVSYHLLSGNDSTSEPLGVDEPWERISNIDPSNRKAFIFGSGDGDVEYCESCGWSPAGSIDDASLIVARGTFTIHDGPTSNDVVHKRQNADLYDQVLSERLHQASLKRLPMIVCNPDKVRPDDELPPMPGKIGDQYQEALLRSNTDGEVDPEKLIKRIGKPFSDVYQVALRTIAAGNDDGGTLDRSRVCMVGDALETDITGGTLNGISTIWVLLDGIHTPELEQQQETDGSLTLEECAAFALDRFHQLENTYAKSRKLTPTYIMPHFRW